MASLSLWPKRAHVPMSIVMVKSHSIIYIYIYIYIYIVAFLVVFLILLYVCPVTERATVLR